MLPKITQIKTSTMLLLLGEYVFTETQGSLSGIDRFDGFALNVGDTTQGYVATVLAYLFEHAAGTNFKLFISMDLAAAKAACAAGSNCCNGVSHS